MTNPEHNTLSKIEPESGVETPVRGHYISPRLAQYGTLTELTRQLSVATPVADALGASNAS
jgi:hypothetical protein